MAGITLGAARGRSSFVFVNITGQRQTIMNLTNYERRKYMGIKDVTEDTGDRILSRARALVNVDSGRLRSSLRAKVTTANFRFEVEIGSDLLYAAYLEYGTGIYSTKGTGRKTPWVYKAGGKWWWTKGARPRPYLTPAYNAERDNYLDRLRLEMRDYT